MASQYTPHARSAVSLAYLATQAAVNGNIKPLASSLAMECAGDALACLVSLRHSDFAARCSLAHKAVAEASHWAACAQRDQPELLRWRVALHAWALALDLIQQQQQAG